MKTVRVMAVLAAVGMSAMAAADPGAEAAEDAASSRRTISVTVYGNDSCPQGEGDEIVVCARLPESERYRIPRKLRDRQVSPRNQSWASRVAYNEGMQRDALITGCSILGSSGAGCLAKAIREWRAERRMIREESQP